MLVVTFEELGMARYIAEKVASDLPARYRITGVALASDSTDYQPTGRLPERIVLVLEELYWCPVISVSIGGLTGRYVTDRVGIEVEQSIGYV